MVLMVLGFFITACGAGGSSSSDNTQQMTNADNVTTEESNSTTGEQASMDGDKEEKIAGAILNVISNSFNLDMTIPTNTSNQNSSKVSRKFEINNGEVPCSGGGSITLTYPTADDTYYTYNNCREGNDTINGQAHAVTDTHALFSEEFFRGSVKYTDLHIETNGTTSVFYESLVYSYERHPQYYHVLGFSLLIDGNVTTNLDGGVTANNEVVIYDDYNLTVVINDDGSKTFTVNGGVKTECLDSMIYINTSSPVTYGTSEESECPISGNITVQMDGSSTDIAFNVDRSLDVTIEGGVLQHFNTCNELDTGSCSP
jgi:hypothetical protein